jgi:hypothetical protein
MKLMSARYRLIYCWVIYRVSFVSGITALNMHFPDSTFEIDHHVSNTFNTRFLGYSSLLATAQSRRTSVQSRDSLQQDYENRLGGTEDFKDSRTTALQISRRSAKAGDPTLYITPLRMLST